MDSQFISFHRPPQNLNPKLSDRLTEKWIVLHELYYAGFVCVCQEIREWEVVGINGNDYYEKDNSSIIQ